MIHRLPILLGIGLLGLGLTSVTPAAPALACTAGGGPADCASRHEQPRIIFGETPQSDFEWRKHPVPRRTNAANRRAYFGSGSLYSDSLAGLQAQMDAIRAREDLEGLALTPAQEAAKSQMSPALARALALAKQSREAAPAGAETN